MITIVLVDDQVWVRRVLRLRLEMEPDFQVVGEADDGAAAIVIVLKLQPNVAVMDLIAPHLDGIKVTQVLQKLAPKTAVLILTLHDDPITRAQALAAGAVEFVGKYGNEQELIAAIRRAARRDQNQD